MTADEMRALKPGDLIRHKHSAAAVIVHANNGGVTAVRVTTVSNPAEWDRVDGAGRVITDIAP
ncbi:hypothetical protein M9978_16545 [Sphingomonas sp. MG17]|uniref:Uncharacterized protein n=1 Tax=Sphingomonas tagetis TaxID=2949092 RepID=A0A9X2HP88_9SPHN|nr:hypothetical protein [Sphingomonas tagetis]MCP3732036.1 hypothetical protein [Sphingomonas tagetis]